MVKIDCSHYPSADDISFDSLEYLFNPAATVEPGPVPWVDLVESKVSQKHTTELEARLEVLEQKLQQRTRELQRVCILIGYMQGLMHEKDEQLKTLPDLRFRAALAVASRLEVERHKEKIQELCQTIERLSPSSSLNQEGIFSSVTNWLSTDEAAITILNWLGLIGLTGILLTIIRGF